MPNHHPRAVPKGSDEQRGELQGWLRRRKRAQSLALRARIVLQCADGKSDMAVAAALGTTRATVGKWRRRFPSDGCDGLLDEPRPGAPRKVSDGDVERVVTRTLESLPRGATQWSRESMATDCGPSPSAVGRIWRAFGLEPHRCETFKLWKDPLFVEKARDITGLYLDPQERAVVLCADGKSQVQALVRTQPVLPMRPDLPECRTRDCKRNGTTSLFAALNTAAGEVTGKCCRRHRSVEFKKFLALVHKAVPPDLDIPLVLDNYGTHKTAMIHNWLGRHPLPPALHADEHLVDQSGRALVRGTHAPSDPARHAPQHAGAGDGDQGVPSCLQRGSEALRLDEDGRPNPRIAQILLYRNF